MSKYSKINIDESRISYTRWNCIYHIVFIPKYRRKSIYGKLRQDIGVILRQLCVYKDVELVEGSMSSDHVHMCVKVPPKLSISQFMGYLKGKSCLMIFERHANLKYKYGSRKFWAKGYYVSTIGLNKQTIQKYIRNQEEADQMVSRISEKEHQNPFKGYLGCQPRLAD